MLACDDDNSLLRSAEVLDRHLDQQLCYFALRVDDAMQKLELFQQLLSQQIDEKEALREEKEEARRSAAAAVSSAAEVAMSGLDKGEDDDDELRHEGNKTQPHVATPEPTVSPQVAIVSAETSHQHPHPPPSVIAVPVAPIPVLPGTVASADDQEEDADEELKTN